jgi:hypothetical protein
MKYPGKIFNPRVKPDAHMEWFERAAEQAGFQKVLESNGKNPCLALYGHGQAGVRCKECRLLFRHSRYFKCELRGFTHGPGTDHRANWPACGRFVR